MPHILPPGLLTDVDAEEQKVREEVAQRFRPLLEAARSDAEYRRLRREMLEEQKRALQELRKLLGLDPYCV